jgi:hypothetical protein
MVDLRQQRHAPALEPVDHVQLPQRPAAVERPGEDALDGVPQLLVVAGRRHRGVADVEVDVEVGILDPVRIVEPERNRDEPARERRKEVQALTDEAGDACVGDLAARRGRRVVHGKAAHVPVGPGCLDREELGVQARELLHFGVSPSGFGLIVAVPGAHACEPV